MDSAVGFAFLSCLPFSVSPNISVANILLENLDSHILNHFYCLHCWKLKNMHYLHPDASIPFKSTREIDCSFTSLRRASIWICSSDSFLLNSSPELGSFGLLLTLVYLLLLLPVLLHYRVLYLQQSQTSYRTGTSPPPQYQEHCWRIGCLIA